MYALIEIMSLTMGNFMRFQRYISTLCDIENVSKMLSLKLLTILSDYLDKKKCFMVCYVIKNFLDWCLLNELKLIKPENLFSTYMFHRKLFICKAFHYMKNVHTSITLMMYTLCTQNKSSMLRPAPCVSNTILQFQINHLMKRTDLIFIRWILFHENVTKLT